MKSRKTTIAAILTAAAIILMNIAGVLDDDPTTTFDMSAVIAALGVLGVGWFARDNDKSSEDVGVK